MQCSSITHTQVLPELAAALGPAADTRGGSRKSSNAYTQQATVHKTIAISVGSFLDTHILLAFYCHHQLNA